MISTGFAYGERSKIADAYAKMYAPKSLMNESCECGKKGCTECGGKDGGAKKTKTLGKLPVKHKVPAKTGSKLGVRKVLPFEKRDSKSSVKKFTPKTKKVSESTRYFCIADGDRVLCTNDIGESYFNKGGTCGDMRIYESKISAMKDISKVKARRNPNSKYKVRACECIGESVQFADSSSGHPVNEGLWDGIKSIGGGVWDAAKGVGNVVGGVAKGAGNLLQGNLSQAAKDVGSGVWDGVKGVGQGVGGVVKGAAEGTLGTVRDLASAGQGVADAVGSAVQGDLKQSKEDLLGAQSSAQGAVADGAREANTAGTIVDGAKAAGKAVGNAALQGAKAVGNTAAAAGNAVGGALKSVGNLAQGNIAQAGKDAKEGLSAAGQNMSDAGKNLANAATGNNGQQPQQGAPAGLEPKVNNGGTSANIPPTQAQIDALNAGHGPVSQQTAEQIQQQNAAKNPAANNPAMQLMPDSLKNYMNQQKPAASQGGQQGNNASRKAEYDQKLAALKKEYADVAG